MSLSRNRQTLPPFSMMMMIIHRVDIFSMKDFVSCSKIIIIKPKIIKFLLQDDIVYFLKATLHTHVERWKDVIFFFFFFVKKRVQTYIDLDREKTSFFSFFLIINDFHIYKKSVRSKKKKKEDNFARGVFFFLVILLWQNKGDDHSFFQFCFLCQCL